MPLDSHCASSEKLRATLEWVAHEYERMEAELLVVKTLHSADEEAPNALRVAGNGTSAAPRQDSCVPRPLWTPPCIPGSIQSEPMSPMYDSKGGQTATPTVTEQLKKSLSDMMHNEKVDPVEADDARKKRLDALASQGPAPLFQSPAMLDDHVKTAVASHLKGKQVYNVEDLYHTTGFWQALAKNRWFDNGTFAVILLNSIWLSVDTDHNHADILLNAHPVFFVAEQAFTLYFAFEVTVRFLAFAKKSSCLTDAWFVFDSILAFLMVLESWVITIVIAISTSSGGGNNLGSTSVLKLAKMLRIIRMLRVARLMRSCPEFFILMKAISSASRATFFTVAFLFVILYVYGIAFTLLLREKVDGFSSVSVSIQTLFFSVTLGDGIADVTQAVLEESWMAMLLLASVILMCTITLMNTLIGVLCEAISAVADKERMAIQVAIVEATLRQILEAGDTDHDGSISKDEFVTLMESKTCVLLLEDIGIDVMGLAETADYFFEEHFPCGASDMSRRLEFEDFMQLLLQLRGSNKATVKDIVDLRAHIHKILRNMDKVSAKIDTLQRAQEELRPTTPIAC